MDPIIILGPNGLPLTCDLCGKPANGSYLNTVGRNVQCCPEHNPFKIAEVAPS